VRICYDPAGNVILRLEIRDFKGEPKNYATGIFPMIKEIQAPDVKKPPSQLPKNLPTHGPWLSSLIVLISFLDPIAIAALFLPYLRTFRRIKTMTIRNCVVPAEFEPGRKMKLRHSMIFWDRENHAVWLRPRGFNLIQIPVTVAKLNIGSDERSIVGAEIRFSWGLPLLLILFVLVAYQFSSAIEASGAKGLPPGFLPGFGVVAIVIGLVNLRILRLRMEKIVQDALSEIGGN
jgi:hypothetical protein